MRYCLRCQTTYDDEMQFCLEDGAALLNYSSSNSPPPTVAFGETETVVRQNVTLPAWEQSQITRLAKHQPEAKKSNAPLIAVVTALTLLVLLGGAVGAWLLAGGSNRRVSSGNSNVTNDTYKFASPSPTIITRKGTGWEPIDNQASLNGTNLTYYRGSTVEQCQADCDKNSKCKAFTLIRAGAYNPNDPPMCYLAAEVTGSVPSACCISAIKSESGGSRSNRVDTNGTPKACDYFLSGGLYEKWRKNGGKDGKLGCPAINETEAEKSPRGTTGRLTRFSKGDGAFIIRHESGKFNGTAFEVSGCMFKLYDNIGGTKSWLGFPVQDEVSTLAGARQDFENGYILWDSKTYDCQAFEN